MSNELEEQRRRVSAVEPFKKPMNDVLFMFLGGFFLTIVPTLIWFIIMRIYDALR